MSFKFRYFLLLAMLSSCSLIEGVALKTTASIINKGSDEILTDGNWNFFYKSVPANLKLIEGLWFSDQTNIELLGMLVKGYAAYGYAGQETVALKDLIEEKEDSHSINQAIMIYEKAIFYGLKYLEQRGIEQKLFFNKSFGLKLKKKFDEKLSDQDFKTIFYFAQALGSRINIQRDNVVKMAYISHVKEMIKWVCTKKPDLERGSCMLLNAVMEASTPSLLGGSQKLAKKMFLKTIKEQPYNLLARVSYIQFHLIPLLEEDQFKVEMSSLKRDLGFWNRYMLGENTKNTLIYKQHRDFNLFNSVANKKYSVLKKLKRELF